MPPPKKKARKRSKKALGPAAPPPGGPPGVVDADERIGSVCAIARAFHQACGIEASEKADIWPLVQLMKACHDKRTSVDGIKGAPIQPALSAALIQAKAVAVQLADSMHTHETGRKVTQTKYHLNTSIVELFHA